MERKSRDDDHYLPTSERLHRQAWEQRQRTKDCQTRVETAARLRANPKLKASSRALPRNRGDVAQRLHEQALLMREDVLERERMARIAPRGATFHPDIDPRSELLARRRRRDDWGLSVLDRLGGGGHIEEKLLAEGILYEHRRQERQERLEEMEDIVRQSPKTNCHSERLLRAVGRRGIAQETQSEFVLGDGPRVLEAGVGGDGVEQESFIPTLQAFETSKKLLESR